MYYLAFEGLGGSSIIQKEILQYLRTGMRGVGHITMGGIYVSLGLVLPLTRSVMDASHDTITLWND